MVELLEVILVEVVEEPAGADRMPGDFEVVNVAVPVRADLVDALHGQPLYYRSTDAAPGQHTEESDTCFAISTG